jgi:hypothetical protein
MLKRPLSSNLENQSKKAKKMTGTHTNQKWCQLADEKKQIAQQKKMGMEADERRKEAEEQRKVELHKITLTHMEEEHQQKMRHREEEHNLRMQILKKDKYI